MPKRPLKLKIRIPSYEPPRNAWRKLVHQAVMDVQCTTSVVYKKTDKLEMEIRLYFKEKSLGLHDVDNRLKDILDALQGHVGGHKKKHRSLHPIIHNDNQVRRVLITKASIPKQSKGKSHLIIRKLPRGTRVPLYLQI